MSFKTLVFFASPFFIAPSTYAAELNIVESDIQTSCEFSFSSIFEMSRTKALNKLDDISKYQQVSAWIESAQYDNWLFPKQPCFFATGKSKATFVEKDKLDDPDWNLTIDGHAYYMSGDEFGWKMAFSNAQDEANRYCGGRNAMPLQIEKISIEEEGNFKKYTIKANFKCVKNANNSNPELQIFCSSASSFIANTSSEKPNRYTWSKKFTIQNGGFFELGEGAFGSYSHYYIPHVRIEVTDTIPRKILYAINPTTLEIPWDFKEINNPNNFELGYGIETGYPVYCKLL